MTNRSEVTAPRLRGRRYSTSSRSPSDFGRDEAFKPMWPQVIDPMQHALDQPRHGEFHYRIFWKMLHGVAVPEPAAFVFGRGLKERLKTISYTRRSRGLIETWLKEYGQ